ncbi:MAG: hypothetical protein ACXVBW_11275, partial [Bdellovibrionota bacterium]
AAGTNAGYQQGYTDEYNACYAPQYNAAYNSAYTLGYHDAKFGYDPGFSDGYNDGYSVGYSAGLSDGGATCPSGDPAPIAPSSLKVALYGTFGTKQTWWKLDTNTQLHYDSFAQRQVPSSKLSAAEIASIQSNVAKQSSDAVRGALRKHELAMRLATLRLSNRALQLIRKKH